MKKIWMSAVVIILVFAVVACGGKKEEQVEEAEAVTEAVEPIASEEPIEEDEAVMITATVNTDIVRESMILIPTAEFDVIGVLSSGSEAELIEAGVEWHKVSVDGKEGYVKAEDVEGVEPLPSPYYIYIEKGSHTITIYERNENGEYANTVATFLTATGLTPAKTPTGVFAIMKKYEWKQFDSAGTERDYSYSPYVSQFTSGIYIHGPVFMEQDFNTMYGNTYKEIGTNATAGCMRTNVGAAYWIYMNCPMGTTVEVVNGSPKGIETPELIDPIHDSQAGKYYDQTDPLGENPISLVD